MINKLHNTITPINKVESTKVHNNITFGQNKPLFITVLKETQKNFSAQITLSEESTRAKFKKAYHLDISLNQNNTTPEIIFNKNSLCYTKNLTIINKI